MEKVITLLLAFVFSLSLGAQEVDTTKIENLVTDEEKIVEKQSVSVHKGFYLNANLGYNLFFINVKPTNDTETKYSGSGATIDLKIGGAIREDLILHLSVISNASGTLKAEYGGSEYDLSDELTIGEVIYGGGLTYYTSKNYYYSASGGYSTLVLSNETETYRTEGGFGFQVKIGKEWMLGKRIGLGIAATYMSSFINNSGTEFVDEKIATNNFGFMMSMSIN